jgi:hypothetical protein
VRTSFVVLGVQKPAEEVEAEDLLDGRASSQGSPGGEAAGNPDLAAPSRKAERVRIRRNGPEKESKEKQKPRSARTSYGGNRPGRRSRGTGRPPREARSPAAIAAGLGFRCGCGLPGVFGEALRRGWGFWRGWRRRRRGQDVPDGQTEVAWKSRGREQGRHWLVLVVFHFC